jgi:hypothetical protein
VDDFEIGIELLLNSGGLEHIRRQDAPVILYLHRDGGDVTEKVPPTMRRTMWSMNIQHPDASYLKRPSRLDSSLNRPAHPLSAVLWAATMRAGRVTSREYWQSAKPFSTARATPKRQNWVRPTGSRNPRSNYY